MRNHIGKVILLTSFVFLLSGLSAKVYAEEAYCEVMAVEGTATVTQNGVSAPVKQGDHLQTDAIIQVASGSYLDLAYDKAWKNVTRIRENSEVKLSSVQPTHLDMKRGDIFSRIKALPKDSSFEVQTPTAIAAVRGTEFRTIAEVDGQTEVHNLSESPDSHVLVYGLDAAGNRQPEPLTLDVEKKTEVEKPGDAPMASRSLSKEEMAQGRSDNMALKETGRETGNGNVSSGDDKDRKDKKPGDDDKKIAMGPGHGPGGDGSDSGNGGTNNSSMAGGTNFTTRSPNPPPGTTYNVNTGVYTAPNGSTYDSKSGTFTPSGTYPSVASSGTTNTLSSTPNPATGSTTTYVPSTNVAYTPSTNTLSSASNLNTSSTTTYTAPTTTYTAPTTTYTAPTTTYTAPTTTYTAPTTTYVPSPPVIPSNVLAVQNTINNTITSATQSIHDKIQQCHAQATTAEQHADCDKLT